MASPEKGSRPWLQAELKRLVEQGRLEQPEFGVYRIRVPMAA